MRCFSGSSFLLWLYIYYLGLKLNKNKTEGIWLGRLKHTKDKYENITWTNEPIKRLGVYFGYNKTQCDQLNYEKQINKCKAIIKNWNLLFLFNLRPERLPNSSIIFIAMVISCFVFRNNVVSVVSQLTNF
jgi:hypothetical protein